MTDTSALVHWTLDLTSLPERPPTHAEESYSSYYLPDPSSNDTAFRLHPNGLCLIGLAPRHAALRQAAGTKTALDVVSATDGLQASADTPQPHVLQAVDQPQKPQQTADAARPEQQGAAPTPADVPRGAELSASLVLAPKLLQAAFRKGRGPLLQADSVLGRLSVAGTEYALRCGVRGLLLELNERLETLQGQELLNALQEGYIAIVEPRAAEAQQLAARCLSREQYLAAAGST